MPVRLIRKIPRALCANIFSAAVYAALPAPLVHAQATRPATAPSTLPAAPSQAGVFDGLPVLSVKITGNTRTDTALIVNQIRTQAGLPYSDAIAGIDTKAISALDRFVSVEAKRTGVDDPQTHTLRGVTVEFIVEERALVTSVEIAGNRKFSDADIREHLIVRAGSAIDPFTWEQDRKYIIDMYQKKGYAQVSVDIDKELIAKQGIVRYQIIEGPLSQIYKIEVVGNTAVKTSYIKWHIQTKTYLWILRKGIVEEEKIQQDVSTIRDMFLKKGYLDARVSYALDYSPDKSKVTLRFIVLEGIQYRIGKIIVAGNTVFPTSELLAGTSKFGSGSIAESDKIDVLLRHIQDAYGHEGYVYSEVLVDKNGFTDTPGIIDLKFTITEGQPYTVGRVIVRGNQNIQDRVIRRQMRIYPDQTFDMVQVRKSVERLKASHLWQDVKVTPNTFGNPPGVADALVEVAEGQTGKFSVGAGVSTNSGLVGQISLEQQNFDITNWPHSFDEFLRGQSFKGAGQYFRLLLEPGTEFQRYRVTFQEPYLFDTPYSFGNDLYFFTRARESWDERRIGDIVTFGHRFSDIWAASVAFRAEQVTITNPQDVFSDRITQSHQPVVGPNGHVSFFNDTAQEILNEEDSTFLTSIKPAISRDTRDSQSFPTSGSRLTLSLEQYGAFGGKVDMTKIVVNFDWYYTLYTDLFDRKTVFALRNELGLIPWGQSPTFERFYLGGIGELRGFKFRGISPRSGPLDDPIGGNLSWFTTAEVNYPIYQELLRGVVFFDVGTVESDITIGNIRSDVGAGIRLSLPFFGGLPIAVDFSYPVTKQSFDQTQFISVSLGIPF